MSRSGYVDDCEHAELYRANVDRTLASKRGQAFLNELGAEMDAMPEKVLIAGALIDADGDCCTAWVVGKARGIDASKIDCEAPEQVGAALGISRIMAAEIEYENDEAEWNRETPQQRWQRMRRWVAKNLKAAV